MRFDALLGFWPEQEIRSTNAPYLVQQDPHQEHPEMTDKPSEAVMAQLGLKTQEKTEDKVAAPLAVRYPNQPIASMQRAGDQKTEDAANVDKVVKLTSD